MARYCRDPWAKKSKKGMKSLDTMFGIAFAVTGAAISAASSSSKPRRSTSQVSQVRRQMAAIERARIANEKQRERAQRQREREQKALEKERERLARERAKQDALEQKRLAQEQLEAEMDEINETNCSWSCLNDDIEKVITDSDIEKGKRKADRDFESAVRKIRYDVSKPTLSNYIDAAKTEAKKVYGERLSCAETELLESMYKKDDVEATLGKIITDEPKIESFEADLFAEAKQSVSAFWPWTKKRLVKEYVDERLNERYQSAHNTWQEEKQKNTSIVDNCIADIVKKKKTVDGIKDEQEALIKEKSSALLEEAMVLYNKDKNKYEEIQKSKLEKQLEQCHENFMKMSEGSAEFISSSIDELIDSFDLPMEFFVEYVYNEAEQKVMIDLDLPEVEDIPLQKIGTTPSGKRTIKAKSQKDVREDYVNCICGLSQYIAGAVFNITPKIKSIEITGYTQIQDAKTALITDQYVIVASFDRETFAKVEYNKLSALQIMGFFKHYMNMTKAYVLKELDLDDAFEKMTQSEVVNYNDYMSNYHGENEEE